MDLRVDYQLLLSIRTSLINIGQDIEGIEAAQAGIDAEMGSAEVASAMANFAGDWSSHRQNLLTQIGDLGDLVADVIARFEKADKDVNPPGPGAGGSLPLKRTVGGSLPVTKDG